MHTTETLRTCAEAVGDLGAEEREGEDEEGGQGGQQPRLRTPGAARSFYAAIGCHCYGILRCHWLPLLRDSRSDRAAVIAVICCASDKCRPLLSPAAVSE